MMIKTTAGTFEFGSGSVPESVIEDIPGLMLVDEPGSVPADVPEAVLTDVPEPVCADAMLDLVEDAVPDLVEDMVVDLVEDAAVEVVEDVVEDMGGGPIPPVTANCLIFALRSVLSILPVKYEAPTPYANTGTSTPV